MHIFVFSVLGLLMVGGSIYLYRDIKRMSSWRIDDRPAEGNLDVDLLSPVAMGLESDSVEHATTGIATQVGHLAEGIGHILHH
jgi:hypothetical protein